MASLSFRDPRLQGADLCKFAGRVSAAETRRQPDVHEFAGQLGLNDLRAEGDDVGIIALPRATRAQALRHGSGEDARHLVRGDGHAQARAAHQHASLEGPLPHGFRHRRGYLRVVHRIGGERPEVPHR
jgi:hypothetical protein